MLEQLLVGLLVLGALGFVARRAWRALAPARGRSSGGGCGGDCGCGH